MEAINCKHPAMSKKELAGYYKISRHILNQWIKKHSDKIGAYEGRKYTPSQVSVIISIFGENI